jgi:hypothetical protein
MSAAVERIGIGPAKTRWRLLLSLVRRSRRSWFFWTLMLPNIMHTLAENHADVRWVVAGSMSVALLLHFELSGRLDDREHRVLPITNRDLWVTEWLGATLIAPVVTLALQGIGVARTGPGFISLETLSLSAFFNAVYVSALMPLREWALSKTNSSSFHTKPAPSVPVSLAKLVFLAPLPLFAFVGPFLFAKRLPISIAEFSTTSVVVLIACALVSIAGLAWTPSRGDYLMWRKATPAVVPENAPVSSPAKARSGDGRVGISGVMWPHMKTTLVLTLAGIAMAIIAEPFLPSREFNARFLLTMLLVFSLIGVSLSSIWEPWALRLKVLPLTVHQINALFVITPLVTWLVIWLMLLLAHVMLRLPIPVELGPLAVLSYASLCALAHALTRRFGNTHLGRTLTSMSGVIVAAAMAVTLAEHRWIPVQPVFALVGVSSLMIAALINNRTLTRSSSSALVQRIPT